MTERKATRPAAATDKPAFLAEGAAEMLLPAPGFTTGLLGEEVAGVDCAAAGTMRVVAVTELVGEEVPLHDVVVPALIVSSPDQTSSPVASSRAKTILVPAARLGDCQWNQVSLVDGKLSKAASQGSPPGTTERV